MFEPHLLVDHGNERHRATSEGLTLLEELDRLVPVAQFDSFPKIQSTYTSQSRRGGVLTSLVGLVIFLLVLNDLGEYLYGAPEYAFQVDHDVAKELQLNVDLTIAMPCQYLTVDLRDAVGDRLHLSEGAFVKDPTTFTVGRAQSSLRHTTAPSASEVISSARRRAPNQRKALSGIRRLFSSRTMKQQHSAYRATDPKLQDGPACRVYGSIAVKKTTGNLHVTTMGHGYMSYEHTDHSLMNLTHIFHEVSFGEFFPSIAQPLDMSYERTDQPFTSFQYFLRVVPSTYIDASRRRLSTYQYAVTEGTARSFDHGQGVPGIFVKFDLEPIRLEIREATTSLYQFLVRLAGVVGGVWTVAAFSLRVFNRAQKEVKKAGDYR